MLIMKCVSYTFQSVIIHGYTFFFFKDTATPEIYTSIDTLSLHDALPIHRRRRWTVSQRATAAAWSPSAPASPIDRKSTRSELQSPIDISYAVFCLKKKKKKNKKNNQINITKKKKTNRTKT